MPNASVAEKKNYDGSYLQAVSRAKQPVPQDTYHTVPFESTEPQEQKHPHYDVLKAGDCMVCKLVDGTVPARVVHENDDFVAVLDVMPKAIGHVTVLCRRHNEGFESMTDIERSTYADFIAEIASRMKSRLGATGYVVVSPVCTSEGHETKHFMSHIMPVYGKAQDMPVMSLIPNQSVPEFVMEDVKKKLTSVKTIAHENQARKQARYFS
ncbi:MAG: HIT family protein [Candidatus Aenigmarchaeota archaeon]|nr:HIT family protein [Candidatus Aenigmarchaeota archaeon]